VSTGGGRVHLGLAYGAVLVTLVHQSLNFLVTGNGDGLSSGDRNFTSLLANLEFLLALVLKVDE